MSMPNIPNIKPDIKLSRREVIDIILASIGLEELSLAHILNAEAEKLQLIIAKHNTFSELMKGNRSVEKVLRDVIKKEMLLQFKLEDVIDYLIYEYEECEKDHFPEE